MALKINECIEQLQGRNEELRRLKREIHEEYTKLKNVNAINMEKILDFRFNFPKIWESQIENKVKHSVDITIQETNSKLKPLVKIHDEKV